MTIGRAEGDSARVYDPNMRRAVRLFVVGIGIALVLALLPVPCSAAVTGGAKALEARLYAPCCYGGTLDIHDSDLARSLREEIELRVARGEDTDAIQADFVARYGDKVLAARSDASLRTMGLAAALLALLSGAALVLVVRRWTRRHRERPVASMGRGTKDALDERIDAELAELDV